MHRSGFDSVRAPRAVYLARQVTIADIDTDPFWEYRRAAAQDAGLRSAWSAPIAASDGRMIGTFTVYQRQIGVPLLRDQELMFRMSQIAGIAIERRAAEDALRDSEEKFRSLFDGVMEGVYRTTRDGRLLVANPAFVQMLGYASRRGVVPGARGFPLLVPERPRYLCQTHGNRMVRCVTKNMSCGARTAR